jgi:uncharacterized protein (TIGR00725 family)
LGGMKSRTLTEWGGGKKNLGYSKSSFQTTLSGAIIHIRMTKKQPIIAVIGGGSCNQEEAQLAEEVGRELAKCGAALVCGGLGGVMEAACKGASAEGGVTIGVLPGDDRRAANPYVNIPIVTNLGYARNVAVVKSGQAVIAVGGNYGTLSEISHALQSGIPVVGLGTWTISRNCQEDKAIIIAKNAAEAVEKALKAVKESND